MKVQSFNFLNSQRIENAPQKIESVQNRQSVPRALSSDTFCRTSALPKASRPSFGANPEVLFNKALKTDDLIMFKRGLKNIVNLPCGYCGAPMLLSDLTEVFATNYANLSGGRLADMLNKFSVFLAPNRRKLIGTFIDKAKENPELKINEIVDMIGIPKQVEVMRKQLKVLIELENKYAKFCSTEERKEYVESLRSLWDYVPAQFAWHNYEPASIRIMFEEQYPLAMLNRMTPEQIEQFKNTVQKLEIAPTSEDLFLLRYVDSAPEHVLRRLGAPVAPTIEHVAPRFNGGEDTADNIMVVCKQCNRQKGSKTLSEYVDKHPEVQKSIGRQFTILKGMLDGKLEPYLSNISKTIMKESEGKIDLSEFVKL